MSSSNTTETICVGHELGPAVHHTEHPKVPDDVYPDLPEDNVEYWDDLDKDSPGVESQFYQAINTQMSSRTAERGRVAVLRMSHAVSQDDGALDVEGLAPRKIVLRTLQHPSSPPHRPNSAFNTSESSDAPEGLVFEDLSHFKKVLGAFPRRNDAAGVPRFFKKQLIVLEDLGKDWVETIGKTFQVPVRVFALHWASPSLYKSGRARLPLGQPAEEHFVLPYSEILRYDIRDGMIIAS